MLASVSKYREVFLNVLRIVAGFLWLEHGVQKLFAVLVTQPRSPAEFLTQFWFAGVIEFFGGTLIMLGLFTRPVAFIAAGEMAWAYFQAHFPRGFWPILNGGESPVLYCFTWLYMFASGGGSFSLDGWIARMRKGESRPA